MRHEMAQSSASREAIVAIGRIATASVVFTREIPFVNYSIMCGFGDVDLPLPVRSRFVSDAWIPSHH